MGRKIKADYAINASPQQVCAALRDREVIGWWVERQDDADDFDIKVKTQTPQRHVYDIVVDSRSSKVKSRVDWDLTSYVAKWSYKGPWMDNSKVKGKYRIEPTPTGSILSMRAKVKIGLPYVGRMLEDELRSRMKKDWSKLAEVVGKRALELGPRPA